MSMGIKQVKPCKKIGFEWDHLFFFSLFFENEWDAKLVLKEVEISISYT